MTRFSITYVAHPKPGRRILIPGGFTTPHAKVVGIVCDTAPLREVAERHTGQTAFVAESTGEPLSLRFIYDDALGDPYPDAVFDYRPSRFTRVADALIDEVAEIAPTMAAADRARAIACATAERFTYGHPEATFNDGMDEVPALGCGVTEGSCVDINTYFIASLRAAGIEAGYVTGFYFPSDKGDWCEDGHCWVVTRTEAGVQEWDIAHHLKMGTREIAPGLNPKPGFRAAGFHSMGLAFPDLGVADLKALIEPVMLSETGAHGFEAPDIRLHNPAIVDAASA